MIVLRVTIELIPYSKGTPVVLGVANIANVGGTPTRGEYRYSILAGKDGRVLARGEVQGFPRKRLLAWDLLARVLAQARKGKT